MTDSSHSRSELGSSTGLNLLSASSGELGYCVPRLAVDYISSLGLTVGASAGFQLGDESDGFVGAVAATFRAGYFLPARPGLELWPRIGVSVRQLDGDDDDDPNDDGVLLVSATTYALTLELPLLFHLSDVLALSLKPQADLHLGQNGTVDSNNIGARTDPALALDLSQYGAQLGMTALF